MWMPSFMQVSFQLQGFPCRRRGWGLVLTAPLQRRPERLERGTAYAKASSLKQPIERLRLAIDCMPVATRKAMLAGVLASERVLVGAYTDGDGGVCPMLAAHRAGGRTDFISFAKAWDRFARCRGASRPATGRETGILVAQLEASLAAADGCELDRAIAAHHLLVAASERRRPREEEHDPRGEIRARRLRPARLGRSVPGPRRLAVPM